MGAFIWLATGIILAIVLRVIAMRMHWGRGAPSAGATIVGAVIGGYLADLPLHGDAVMDFRGPTAIGAIVGGLLLAAATYAIGWTSGEGSERPELG